MAVDATGTPTTLGIPTYNTPSDKPSGQGFNAAMAVIDTLMQTANKTPVTKAGSAIGTRRGINFIEGAGISITAADNSGNDRVDVTIAAASSEVVAVTSSSDEGPTGITTTGTGDVLFSFPATTFEAVKHYFEFSYYAEDSTGGAELQWFFMESTTQIGTWRYRTPSTNPGTPAFIRIAFTPTAGSHTYSVKWRDVTTGRSYTVKNSTYPRIARIVKA